MSVGSRLRTGIDEGVTLVELLISVAILGIAGTVIVGGMFMYTTASGVHRSQAAAQLELRRYAEAVANTAYQPGCATSYPMTGYTSPTGFAAPINTITFWNPATGFFDITPAAGCTNPKLERVRLTVSVTASSPYSESVDIVKRDPAP